MSGTKHLYMLHGDDLSSQRHGNHLTTVIAHTALSLNNFLKKMFG